LDWGLETRFRYMGKVGLFMCFYVTRQV